jgi:hypothetical protein
MHWLDYLKNELFTLTNEAAKEYWPKPTNPQEAYFNYRFEHVTQVEREAKRLLHDLGADADIVLASVWLHDRYQPVFQGPEPHGELAAVWASEHLNGLGFPPHKIAEVCYALRVHSNPPQTIPAEKREARILWDADKLTHYSPTELVIDFFTKLVAKDRLENIPQERYRRAQYTIEEIVLHELSQGLTETIDVNLFYFQESNARGQHICSMKNRFYELLRSSVS